MRIWTFFFKNKYPSSDHYIIHIITSTFSVLSKHNLCLDNCHSHVAMALNLMRYDNSASWNMVNLCARSFIHGKHVR